jgi:hypothetical protein
MKGLDSRGQRVRPQQSVRSLKLFPIPCPGIVLLALSKIPERLLRNKLMLIQGLRLDPAGIILGVRAWASEKRTHRKTEQEERKRRRTRTRDEARKQNKEKEMTD